MEKNNSYDMYDFLDGNITKYNSMYQMLSKYIPELNGDFSTANLINTIPKKINDFGKQKNAVIKFYQAIFGELSSMLLDSAYNRNIDRDGRLQKKLSINERSNLLESCKQAISSPRLKSIDEYIEYAKANDNNPEISELREIIVDTAMQVASKEQIDDFRYKTLSTFYIPMAMNKLKEKYTEEDRISGNCPEWNIMQFIRETLCNESRFLEYDEYVQDHNKKMQAFAKECAIKTVCKAKRNKETMKIIKESMSDEEKENFSKNGLIDTIFPIRQKMEEPKRGQFSWKIDSYKEPQVLMDAMTEYSKDGIENQRVIAVSYGRFLFEKDVIKGDILSPELIGVTRIGKDGVHTYFVIADLDKISFRDKSLASENEKAFSFKIDGQNASFVDKDNGQNYYTFIKTQKIPDNMKKFFAEAFFSDLYLDEVEKQNYGYAGSVENTDNGPAIEINGITDYVLDAVRYANLFPGIVKDKKYASLKEYIDYSDFQINHLRNVKRISEGELSISDRNIFPDNR